MIKDVNKHVELNDNTVVFKNLLYPKSIKGLTKLEELQQLSTQNRSYIGPDTRSNWERKESEKNAKAKKYVEDQKYYRDLTGKVVGAGAVLGGLALANMTPAGPYIDAALAIHSANTLEDQYNRGTLGFNAETGLNTLGLVPLGGRFLSFGVNKITPLIERTNKNATLKSYLPRKTTTSKMIVSDPKTGTPLYTPDEIINSGDFAKGKEMAAKFFEHPVVQESYRHNQRLAERLGLIVPDKPNAAQVVRQPVTVTYGTTQDPYAIAEVARSNFGALDDEITMRWKAFPLNDLRHAVIHENLHRGWYSAPLKPQTISRQYYEKVFKPEYSFWKWKTDKLLSPLGQSDNYLSDVLSGEAGPNLIDLGRDLGLKLGQKYPGYDTAKAMLDAYKGSRAFLIPRLNLTKAGMRHVWDAMTGKYFTPTTGIVIGTSVLNNTNNE